MRKRFVPRFVPHPSSRRLASVAREASNAYQGRSALAALGHRACGERANGDTEWGQIVQNATHLDLTPLVCERSPECRSPPVESCSRRPPDCDENQASQQQAEQRQRQGDQSDMAFNRCEIPYLILV